MRHMSRILAAAGASGAIFLGALLTGLALEPPTKDQLARYRLDGTLGARVARARAIGNHKIPQRIAERLTAKVSRLAGRDGKPVGARRTAALAPPRAWEGMPTSGTVRILALLISFADYPGTTPASTIQSRLFGSGSGAPPFDSLRNFYDRSSYGQLTIAGDVLGWYQAPYDRATVAETDSGRQNLIKEALSYYDAQGQDFSQYDNDGDGTIDYLCVFWTGPHGEWASFWWGYYTWFTDSAYRLDGKTLTNYSWQWELYDYPSGGFTPSVIIHETGHALGVPDYYDYDDSIGPRGGVGGLDIMDGSGDHNAFSKFMLDWLTPTVVSGGSRAVTLRASGVTPDAVLFFPGASGGLFNEYFIVQNRNRVGNDTNLFTGADGLIVWHVDARLDQWNYDFLYDNSYTAHKLLRLMEADGLEEIETWAASADAGDYYRAGMMFGPATVPNTSRYDGLPTAMVLSSITGTTTPMSATITANDAPPTVAITNLIAGQTVYGTLGVEVTASDDNRVARVELYGDDYLSQTLAAPPFSFGLDTTLFANGAHTVRAVAFDSIGLTAEASVAVAVDNLYPPTGLKAAKTVNRSLLLREYVNALTWTDNARNTSVTKFRIYRVTGGGRQLVGEVAKAAAGATYRFLQRGVSATEVSTYDVVAVGALEREGTAATVTAK